MVIRWRATTMILPFLLLIHTIAAEYTMTVFKGVRAIAYENYGYVNPGPLEIGADYSLEIKNTDLSVDYVIESCYVVETGEQIIGPPGCLKCTPVFINMVESTGYNLPGAVHKSSIIHFRPNQEYMSFNCVLKIHPTYTMNQICKTGAGILAGMVALDTIYLYWGTGGLPWWVWLLIILLILLLLLCCCALLAFLFLRWRKNRKVVDEKKMAPPPPLDPRPTFAVNGTQTSLCDRTSMSRMVLESGAENLAVGRADSKQSEIEVARMGAFNDDKVEVFSGHAGVYNVRNGTAHRYEKNPNITRTRHESELFEETDRHSYFNQGYEPAEMRRNVNCVEGFDEVVRYTSDREIGEYDHVEREIETNHHSRFYNDPPPPQPRYFNGRHHSIPV